MLNRNKELTYIIYRPRSTITMDLYEAEKYEPAIIVQSLVGNLSYYSNQGRYEPRLAKSWKRLDSKTWVFELHENLVCENGERITPESFKQSLMRTIAFLAKSDEVPILSKLNGYADFLKGKSDSIAGIETSSNQITFRFSENLRDGLVQILSFSPFGYICSDNLNEDGSWKDKKKFISSGPYRVTEVEIGKRYRLEKRSNWALPFKEDAPISIDFIHELPINFDPSKAYILDAFTSGMEVPVGLSKFPLVPEYINPIVLGNLKTGFFASIENRRWLESQISIYRDRLPNSFGAHTRSATFYPNQQIHKSVSVVQRPKSLPTTPITIEGKIPLPDTPRWFSWSVLKQVLDENKIPYRFADNEADMKFISDPNFDIKLRGSSIGGGVEAWGIRVIFCSELGPRFPDPTGKICKAVDDFDLEKISESDFSNIFFETVSSDAAIIPVSHYGIQLYMSDSIRRRSISPALEIVRFDQIEID